MKKSRQNVFLSVGIKLESIYINIEGNVNSLLSVFSKDRYICRVIENQYKNEYLYFIEYKEGREFFYNYYFPKHLLKQIKECGYRTEFFKIFDLSI